MDLRAASACRRDPTKVLLESGGRPRSGDIGVRFFTGVRMPPTESVFSRPIVWGTRLVIRSPRFVLVLAVIASLASLGVASRWLGIRTNRLDLLNPKTGFNQRWMKYLGEFGDRDDVVAVVEGRDIEQLKQTLEKLNDRIVAEPNLFSSVLYHPDFSVLRGKALNYLPDDQLRSIDEMLMQLTPVLKGDWAQLNVLHQLEWMQRTAAASSVRRVSWDREESNSARRASSRPPRASASGAVSSASGTVSSARGGMSAGNAGRDMVAGFAAALTQPESVPGPWAKWLEGLGGLTSRLDTHYLLDEKQGRGFLLLRIVTSEADFVRGRGAVARLREIVAQVARQQKGVRIGLTGMPILEADEMACSQSDSFRSTLLGGAGVVLALLAGLGGWRGPALAAAGLMLALAWTLGFATLAVGHLNILSMSFGVILVGLGIDFGIHFFARYDQLASEMGEDAACVETARSVGPGIASGAVTTALAFFAASLTQFKGVAELGIIAGGGIMLCLFSALVVLPAMLKLFDRGSGVKRRARSLYVIPACRPFLRHPKLTVGFTVIAVGICVCGLPRLRYDHNLLNLQSPGLESVRLERKLSSGGQRSALCGLSMASSRDELARLKARFESLDVVSGTEEIASLLPESGPDKLELIDRIHQRLAALPQSPPLIPVAPREVLVRTLGLMSARSPDGQVSRDSDGVAVRNAVGSDLSGSDSGGGDAVLEVLGRMPEADYYRRISSFQQASAGDLLKLLHVLSDLSNPEPPRMADVPAELRERYVGRSGMYLLKVYGKGSIWDMGDLERFVRGVERVDPRITGHPVQTFYASRQMQQSYVHAGIYAAIAVLIVLMLDFRSVRYTLLSIVPLVSGMLLLFGLLGLLNVPLNAANLIVLPLILGIGVDNGVHIVHDFIDQRHGYRLSNSTACAVLLCATTTVIGFGSMMISGHQGLQSLGLVLTLGVSCCLVTSLFAFPPLLTLLRPASQPPSDVIG